MDDTSYLITVQFCLIAGEFLVCMALAAIAFYAIAQKDKAVEQLQAMQPVPDKMPGDTLSDTDRFELEQFVRDL